MFIYWFLHFLEKTNPPSSLYLDIRVRTTGPLRVPEDSACFHGACFRNELTSSDVKTWINQYIIDFVFAHDDFTDYILVPFILTAKKDLSTKVNSTYLYISSKTIYLLHTEVECDQQNWSATHRTVQQRTESATSCFLVYVSPRTENPTCPECSWETVKFDSIITVQYCHSTVQLNWNVYSSPNNIDFFFRFQFSTRIQFWNNISLSFTFILWKRFMTYF